MSRSFVGGPPREGATLQELLAYLRPKTRGELATELRSSLLSTTEPAQHQENWGVLTDLGMIPTEFALMALNRPELWDKEQLEYLELVANGYPADNRIVELAEDFFTDAAVPPPRLLEVPPEEEEDLEDEEEGQDPIRRHEDSLTALFGLGPALTPFNSPAEPLPVVGETNDKWWKK